MQILNGIFETTSNNFGRAFNPHIRHAKRRGLAPLPPSQCPRSCDHGYMKSNRFLFPINVSPPPPSKASSPEHPKRPLPLVLSVSNQTGTGISKTLPLVGDPSHTRRRSDPDCAEPPVRLSGTYLRLHRGRRYGRADASAGDHGFLDRLLVDDLGQKVSSDHGSPGPGVLHGEVGVFRKLWQRSEFVFRAMMEEVLYISQI